MTNDAIVSAVERALADTAYQPQRQTLRLPVSRLRSIANEVAQKHGVSVDAMISYERSDVLRRARLEAWYRCRKETRHSTPQIGRFFHRDHSTIVVGAKEFAMQLASSLVAEKSMG